MQNTYKDKNKTIDFRVKDLLSKMTLREKVGQMCQFLLPTEDDLKSAPNENAAEMDDATIFYTKEQMENVPKLIKEGVIGSILSEVSPERINKAQKLAMSSRLGIPILFGIDAIHGIGLHDEATIFAAPINIAASWDTSLAERIAHATAIEMRALNLHWTFSPNIDIMRDGRWGRVGETFGEDPHLVGEIGAAMIKGYQGKMNNPEENVLACAKHYIAGGEPSNGLNFSPMDMSERCLRELHLPPYIKAVSTGARTIMAAHNELNGIPCHANKYLLSDVLRDELGFSGFVVSDWNDIARLHTLHKVAENRTEANKMAVNAGMDMHMHGYGFLESVCELVENGEINIERINAAAESIIRTKFELGLFENPYVEYPVANFPAMLQKHQHLALESARKSLILLKNRNKTLPLKKSGKKRILITGPLVDSQDIMGDWVLVTERKHKAPTIADELLKYNSEDIHIEYYDCGDIHSITQENIDKATELAAKADIVIAALGEISDRTNPGKTEGENTARASLELLGRQSELFMALSAKTKTVAVMVNARPLAIPEIAENADAIIAALHPGQNGGQAIAELIFGEYSPSGKLPYTIPYCLGQLTKVYNYKPSAYFRQYIDSPNEALFEFGHGLSYANFDYTSFSYPAEIKSGETFEVEFNLTNSSDTRADEVVIAYLRDCFSSVTRPVKEVVDFKRVSLTAGETKQIKISVSPDQMALFDTSLKRVIERGEFKLYIADKELSFRVI